MVESGVPRVSSSKSAGPVVVVGRITVGKATVNVAVPVAENAGRWPGWEAMLKALLCVPVCAPVWGNGSAVMPLFQSQQLVVPTSPPLRASPNQPHGYAGPTSQVSQASTSLSIIEIPTSTPVAGVFSHTRLALSLISTWVPLESVDRNVLPVAGNGARPFHWQTVGTPPLPMTCSRPSAPISPGPPLSESSVTATPAQFTETVRTEVVK